MITDFEQRWRNRKAVFIPPTECMDVRQLEVSVIPEAVAKAFVCANHYSASFPASRRRFGLFQHGILVGVAVFSVPVNNLTITNTFKNDNANEGLELGRFVLLDENPISGSKIGFNAESFFAAQCFKVLKKEGFIGVVMFSDDVKRTTADGQICFNGHLGTTYKSLQCAFLGRSSRSKLRLLPDGKVLNARTISKIRNGESGWRYGAKMLEDFGVFACPDDAGQRRQWLDYSLGKVTRILEHPGNLRYALSFRKDFKFNSLPYPRIKHSDLQRSLCLN
jgi:hypothetical protein